LISSVPKLDPDWLANLEHNPELAKAMQGR
jgi:hypothetical protein